MVIMRQLCQQPRSNQIVIMHVQETNFHIDFISAFGNLPHYR